MKFLDSLRSRLSTKLSVTRKNAKAIQAVFTQATSGLFCAGHSTLYLTFSCSRALSIAIPCASATGAHFARVPHEKLVAVVDLIAIAGEQQQAAV
jgi:hypothetical protein